LKAKDLAGAVLADGWSMAEVKGCGWRVDHCHAKAGSLPAVLVERSAFEKALREGVEAGGPRTDGAMLRQRKGRS